MSSIRERIAELKALSKIYAKAKAEHEYLTNFRRSKLAILANEYAVDNPSWSNVRCKDAARGNEEYLQLLEGMRKACEMSEAAKYELEISRAGIQLYQTERADRRAEIKNLGDC